MSTEVAKNQGSQLTAKALFSQDNIKAKFQEMLGKKAQGFITSVLQIVASNSLLTKADPASIYNAAAVAATLDLPLNNNLGFAYIVPYNQKQTDNTYKQVAQFQLGYKGFIQLAQRSGQFKTIGASPIYKGQIKENNPLTGIVFDFTVESEEIVGYAAYFKLLNGFEKTIYMTLAQLKSHGTKYSQTYKKGYGLWKDDFDAMAIKTVIKLLLAKYAPLSIEMLQQAIITDQAIIENEDGSQVTYADNEVITLDDADVTKQKERERKDLLLLDNINACKTPAELQTVIAGLDLTNEQNEAALAKKEEFKKSK